MKHIITAIFVASVSFFSTFSLASNKVLFVLTNHAELGDTGRKTGFWLSELIHPYYVLKDAGFDIYVASIKGGEAPIDPRSMNRSDRENKRYFDDPYLTSSVKNTLILGELDPTNYAAIIYAGGHGAMWDLPNHPDVNKMTAAIYENNGVVAAVCHGPAALTDVKLSNGDYLIAGKQFAAFTNEEEDMIGLTNVMPFLLESKLKEKGGIHVDAGAWSNNAVADQRVVTGQNPASAHKVGELVLKELSSF